MRPTTGSATGRDPRPHRVLDRLELDPLLGPFSGLRFEFRFQLGVEGHRLGRHDLGRHVSVGTVSVGTISVARSRSAPSRWHRLCGTIAVGTVYPCSSRLAARIRGLLRRLLGRVRVGSLSTLARITRQEPAGRCDLGGLRVERDAIVLLSGSTGPGDGEGELGRRPVRTRGELVSEERCPGRHLAGSSSAAPSG